MSTAHFNSSKYVFSTLTRLGLRPGKGQGRLPLLEVGAINTALLACPWLHTTAIDLRARLPGIQQADFLTLPVEPGAFGAVVLSMVLNCVTEPEARGAMLRLAHAHLRPGGALLVGLPRRCIRASAYCSAGRWLAALALAGFATVHLRQTPKLLFCTALAQPSDAPPSVLAPAFAYAQSDLVVDRLVPLQGPPPAGAAAEEPPPSPSVPAWLAAGVREAEELLAAPAPMAAFRAPLPCLSRGRASGVGGDKAAFGVAFKPDT